VIFGIVLAYFIVYEAYFIVGEFCRTIRVASDILLFMPYFLVSDSYRHEWSLRCWSFMGMIGYFGTNPIWACVKVLTIVIHLLQVH
jgi:hypothetical protein